MYIAIAHCVFCEWIQPARGWCATVKRDCANCIHLILPLRRPRPPVFLGKPVMPPRRMAGRAPAPCGRHRVQSRTKTNTKTILHSLNPPHSQNTLIHQSNPLNPPHPHSPQPTHRLTHPHLSNPNCPLCKTHPHVCLILLSVNVFAGF